MGRKNRADKTEAERFTEITGARLVNVKTLDVPDAHSGC
jgi:hypothetical protein